MSESRALKTTPLNAVHRSLGARMVDFGGWDMPVQYSGILAEHHAVRSAVGLFDVSHLGEVDVHGPEALSLVNYVAVNDASRLRLGQAQYSALLNADGGFIDDILVHKVSDDHYFLCINAGNQEDVYRHIRDANRWQAEVEHSSEKYAQLAIQGPRALATVRKLTASELSEIRPYHFIDGEVAGVAARIARTGYTGEDGIELYAGAEDAEHLWHELSGAGEEFGVEPCGLGARNTLRLEAKMALYGHEIDSTINPWEADLAWIVKLDKGDFIGRDALVRAKDHVRRKLMGFHMVDRAIARDGYKVLVDGSPVGWVTSGGPSPTLGVNIGLCYVPIVHAEIGRPIQVMVRDLPRDAELVTTPFYKRDKN